MRTQLATLAVSALLVAPFTAVAETMMPGDAPASGMTMQDSQGTTLENQEKLGGIEKMTAEIVQIKGDRVIAEADNGRVLVFLIQDFNGQSFNVGDGLELKVDSQANTAEVLHVLPRRESPAS
jgi:hypothetical protein